MYRLEQALPGVGGTRCATWCQRPLSGGGEGARSRNRPDPRQGRLRALADMATGATAAHLAGEDEDEDEDKDADRPRPWASRGRSWPAGWRSAQAVGAYLSTHTGTNLDR